MTALQPERVCRRRDVLLMMLECTPYDRPLCVIQHIAQRTTRIVDPAITRSLPERQQRPGLALTHLATRSENHQPLDQILELAHVARKVVGREQLQRAVTQA